MPETLNYETIFQQLEDIKPESDFDKVVSDLEGMDAQANKQVLILKLAGYEKQLRAVELFNATFSNLTAVLSDEFPKDKSEKFLSLWQLINGGNYSAQLNELISIIKVKLENALSPEEKMARRKESLVEAIKTNPEKIAEEILALQDRIAALEQKSSGAAVQTVSSAAPLQTSPNSQPTPAPVPDSKPTEFDDIFDKSISESQAKSLESGFRTVDKGLIFGEMKTYFEKLTRVKLDEVLRIFGKDVNHYSRDLNLNQKEAVLTIVYAGNILGLWNEPNAVLTSSVIGTDLPNLVSTAETNADALLQYARENAKLYKEIRQPFIVWLRVNEGVLKSSELITKGTSEPKTEPTVTASPAPVTTTETGAPTGTATATTTESQSPAQATAPAPEEAAATPPKVETPAPSGEKESTRVKNEKTLKSAVANVVKEVSAFSPNRKEEELEKLKKGKTLKILLVPIMRDVNKFLADKTQESFSISDDSLKQGLTVLMLLADNKADYEDYMSYEMKGTYKIEALRELKEKLAAL